jgi:hypothetical protein|tara:strand:- start:1500 stop:1676 length:177 start_codon:yes stop_codon:yes gene_type:complete
MHDLFHLFLQGNRSSTPAQASPGAPGEELLKVRTIHGAVGARHREALKPCEGACGVVL